MTEYLPQIYTNPHHDKVKYLLRKRILHSGWQVSYCNLPCDGAIWTLLTNTETKTDALNIINNSHH